MSDAVVVSVRLPGLPPVQETDICTGYALEVESTGNNHRFADVFRGVQKIYVSVAEMAEQMLGIEGSESRSTEVRRLSQTKVIQATSRRVET